MIVLGGKTYVFLSEDTEVEGSVDSQTTSAHLWGAKLISKLFLFTFLAQFVDLLDVLCLFPDHSTQGTNLSDLIE